MSIEVLVENDIAAVASILPKMWLSHTASDLVSESNLKSMSAYKYLKEALDDPNQILYVARINNEVAGFIRCEIRETPHFYKERKEAYIDDLIVVEKYRRQGIATKLVEECISWAGKKGVSLFTCKIWEFNEAPAKLFEKFGFRRDYSFYSRR